MSDEGANPPPPPRGLTVRRFAAGDERLALVSFPIEGVLELTLSEVELLRALLRGASNAEIAAWRGTSVKTVSNQVSALLAKCRAGSRGDLCARWLEVLAP